MQQAIANELNKVFEFFYFSKKRGMSLIGQVEVFMVKEDYTDQQLDAFMKTLVYLVKNEWPAWEEVFTTEHGVEHYVNLN